MRLAHIPELNSHRDNDGRRLYQMGKPFVNNIWSLVDASIDACSCGMTILSGKGREI